MRIVLLLFLLVGCTPVSADFKLHDINLDDPTYKQVVDNLAELKWVKIEGNCLDKTKYVQDYFYKKGLQCYVVVSNYKGGFGHSTVAFNTEKGWMYVEPERMAEIPIEVGKPYYIPMKVYNSKPDSTAQDFIEDNTVTQLIIFR